MRKIYAAAVVLTTVAIFYFYLSHNGRLTKEASEGYINRIKLEKLQVDMKQSDLNQHHLANRQVKNKSLDFQFDFGETKDRSMLLATCKETLDQFRLFRYRTDVLEMSERQLLTYEKIEQMCLLWYDYLATLDAETIAEMKAERKAFFSAFPPDNIFSDQPDNQIINRHVKAIAGGQFEAEKNNYNLVEHRVGYLLRFDLDLQLEIGKALGTDHLGFITSAEGAVFTSALLACRYDNTHCESGSLERARACLSHDEACGLSLQEDLQRITTYGQYTDWQNAADILYRLIESGWFAERETVNP